MITSLGTRELVAWLLCFLWVYNVFAVCHNLFSFPLGVIGRLYSVIVALPGHLYFFIVLTLCMLGNFACFLSSRFKKKQQKKPFSKKSFRNTIRLRVSNSLNPDQTRHFVGPDLGSNCLERLSAVDKSRH